MKPTPIHLFGRELRFLVAVLALVGCGPKDLRESNPLQSQERGGRGFYEQMQQFCDYWEPAAELYDQRDALCQVLAANLDDRSSADGYGKLCVQDKFHETFATLKRFYHNHFIRYFGIASSPQHERCLRDTAAFAVETIVEHTLDALAKQKPVDAEVLPNPMENPDQCWVVNGIDNEGCMIAQPCHGSGPSNLRALPISMGDIVEELADTTDELVDEDRKIRLCHEDLAKIHRLKDPQNLTLGFNNPFFSHLTFGHKSPHVTYGAANCHGTAQAIIGGPLDYVGIEHLGFHSPEIERQCGEKAKTRFQHLQQLYSGSVPANALPISKGGHVINMEHRQSCREEEIGRPKLIIDSCAGELRGHVLYDKMCIRNWRQHLAASGLEVADQGSQLKSGCVFTGNDHSVTLVMRNHQICYYYEAQSPYAAVNLRVTTCRDMMQRFDRFWCPQEALVFEAAGWQ